MIKKILFFFFFIINQLAWSENTQAITYDIGAATGSYDGASFFEIHFGLNYPITHFLNWRNSIFYRSQSESSSTMGLDTSMRLGSYVRLSESSVLDFYGGPGYRIASRGTPAPFIEAGITLQGKSFVIGLGLKQILHSVAQKDKKDETGISIILGAGGAF